MATKTKAVKKAVKRNRFSIAGTDATYNRLKKQAENLAVKKKAAYEKALEKADKLIAKGKPKFKAPPGWELVRKKKKRRY